MSGRGSFTCGQKLDANYFGTDRRNRRPQNAREHAEKAVYDQARIVLPGEDPQEEGGYRRN